MTEAKPIGKEESHRHWWVTIVIAAMALMLLLVGSAVRPHGASAYSTRAPMQAGTFNYGEALQKAIWFYEAQISGPKPPWSRVTWRGDSALNDGSDVARDLSGGWFDAGDHVKFGFAMASSATMLAWGGVEYRQAYEDSGQIQHLLNNLRVANDFFIKAHSAPNELYGQIGDAGLDHSFWGPAEIMQMQRPAFKIDLAHGGSDLAAETAAAMAASSIVFRATDPAYANTLVFHARQLFAFAEATYHPNDLGTQGNGNFYVDAIPAAQGFYNSRFGNPNDEMAWAAAWLFLATTDTTFRDRARQLYPTMCKENGTQTPCFTWTQSWNDKHFGTYVLMAKLTGEDQFKTDAQRWLDFWSVGAGTRTTGGLMFVNGFGSLRYATNTAFIALVYADLLGTSNPLYSRYHDFAKRQIDYALGANPANHSYVCGFGNNPPINPHHRTAHGSWVNGGPQGAPTNNRHVLYGGLVCGPTSANDFSWADDRSQFMENEVATDFNAGLAGAAARLFREFGGTPLANFPPVETPDDDEIYIEAGINVAGTNFTEIRAFVINRSAWPARMLDGGTFRYFFTLEPGVTPNQITVNNNFSQCGGGITGPTQWSGNIYYVTINCLGTKIFPGGQSEFRREVQFRIASSGAWNPADDPSFLDIAGATGGQTVRTRRIVLYDDGVRIWGNEPGPPVPDFSLSASPSSLTVNRGASGTSAITITRTGGFTGSVAFSASGLPGGVTATFTPTSTTGNSVSLNLAVSATATLGTATVTITGAGGGPTHTVPISLTVTQPPPPDFTISASPTSVSINRGASGSSTITIARVNGFTSSVGFTTSALPTGVTAAFNPASTIDNSSIVTFSASSTATLGSVIVTISGAGGTLTRTTPITLTVTNPQIPDFTLSASPASLSISVGASGTSTVGINRTGGFTGAVALSATGQPAGVTAAFNPTSAAGASSILTFTASSTATAGTTTVTVTGVNGALTHTVTISLTVTPVQTPNFTLSASTASVTVSQGSSATSTINITRTGGFTANVALSATGLPAGVTAAFNPASAGGASSILTLTASATATTGPATITVTGVGGTLTRTTTVGLTVNAGNADGGVTITSVINASGPWFNEEGIRLSNTGTLTSLSITIVIQRTGGISLNGQYNTVGGQILQSNSTTATAITYQFTLAAGQTLGVGTNRLFAAQTSGSGTVHPTTGDNYTITYTTGGTMFTRTGTF